MRAIKKVNNNVAICVDNRNKELIAFGKGIGFPAMPYEIKDLNVITMTFYRIDSRFYNLIQEIPENVFEVAALIVNEAQMTLKCNLNPNLIVGLADHINFAIVRMKKFKKLEMLFSYDVEQLYPNETNLGRYAVKLIQKKLFVRLPESEITNIAMHFVNAEEENMLELEENDSEALISKTADKIENIFSISINRKGFNYNRFAMHMRYFLKRIKEKSQFIDDNTSIMHMIKDESPEVYECAVTIADLIAEKLNENITEDEILYLMIHINRIIKNTMNNE